jgi:hypothetical protein
VPSFNKNRLPNLVILYTLTFVVADNWLWSSNYQIIDLFLILWPAPSTLQGLEWNDQRRSRTTRQQPRTATSHNCIVLHASFSHACLPSLHYPLLFLFYRLALITFPFDLWHKTTVDESRIFPPPVAASRSVLLALTPCLLSNFGQQRSTAETEDARAISKRPCFRLSVLPGSYHV